MNTQRRVLAVLSAAALLTGAVGVTSASAASNKGVGTIAAPVTGQAACTGTSQFTVTVGSGGSRTVSLEEYSTAVTQGYWRFTLTRQADAGLIGGHGMGINTISDGAWIRISNTFNGSVPKGTSNVVFTAERTDPLTGTGPVLETCSLTLTVTAR